jgi:hypothetical protein
VIWNTKKIPVPKPHFYKCEIKTVVISSWDLSHFGNLNSLYQS